MSKFIDRTNEVNYNKQGEKMTIIRYSKLEGQRQVVAPSSNCVKLWKV